MDMTKVSSLAKNQGVGVLPMAVKGYLGKLTSIEQLPNLFEDSTHEIWRLQTIDKSYALKKCSAHLHELKTAIFWRGVRHLWGLDLTQQLGDYADVYVFLTKYSGLQVPSLLMAQSSDGIHEGWLLNSWMPGVEIKSTSPKLIMQLANHLASLHSQKQQKFGGIIGEQFPLTQWGKQVFDTLKILALEQQVVLPLSESAMQDLVHWVPQSCVPVMLDLRWDQFLQSEQGDLTTLVDCDAFVWAPASLALLQVETMLSDVEMRAFKAEYQKQLPWPEDMQGERREVLMALLTLLQVFGLEPIKSFVKL